MEDFRLTLTGPTDEMEELDQHLRKCGILTEHGLVSSYEGVAVSVFALHAIGRLEVLAQCIAEYGNAKKPRLKVSCFISGEGHRTLTDYTFAEVAEVLHATRELHIEREADAPGKKRN